MALTGYSPRKSHNGLLIFGISVTFTLLVIFGQPDKLEKDKSYFFPKSDPSRGDAIGWDFNKNQYKYKSSWYDTHPRETRKEYINRVSSEPTEDIDHLKNYYGY